MIGEAPMCFECKHLFEESIEERAGREGFRCAAFPELNIPKDIFWGDFIHDKTHPDQEIPGIVFEPKDSSTDLGSSN